MAIFAAFWLFDLHREALHAFWPKDRQPRTLLLFAVQLTVCSALPGLLWELDFRALWPYTDWFRKAPVVFGSLLEFEEGVCKIWILLLQLAVSSLAAVHWPLFLPIAGALIPFLSDTARLFWRLAMANVMLHHCYWLVAGHRAASLLPGEGVYIPFVLLGTVVFICIAPTPQESILLSLLPKVRSAIQHMWAGSSHDKGVSLGKTTAPLHNFSVSGAVSGEGVIIDADAANSPRVCITADGSTVSLGPMQHAVLFSDSSDMPRAPASGRNEAHKSCLHDAGISSSTDSNDASTAVEHLKLVCFWLGAFCGNVIRMVVMGPVTRVARLAQRLWCMQQVQLCVQGINSGFKGLRAPNSPATTSSASPLTGTQQASVPAAAILQAFAAAYMSPRNMHQSDFMSGGSPSVRLLPPLHSTAGYSSPAMQLDGVAGGPGNVCVAVPDQDLASDTEYEVFKEADAVMQPDLLHTEAPLQVRQPAAFNGRSTDDFPGWRQPVAHLRAKLRRTTSVTQTTSTMSDVARSRNRRSVRDRIRAVRLRATPACLSVQ
ncbi:TPA: hypothetical protein ACH3X1_011056 [Trebouxia sp. C0004]